MAIVISRRSRFFRFIDRTQSCLIALREKSSSNQLPVTVRRTKISTRFTLTFPATRNWSKPCIIKALTLRRNPSIQNSNDNLRHGVGFRVKIRILVKPKKLWRTSGMKFIYHLRHHSQNPRLGFQPLSFLRRQSG
uniref:Uncharacterized protein n=1 Tax=Cucumis sativus TaxID=3659 RepID=A0A0A0KFW6_CUCSA